ncbi:MAG: hypothetical protein HQL41_09550, partial [Alphaproteobacteria bacterium]|nr:hypothetical protein [Alphaproteobacteria bacterium]
MANGEAPDIMKTVRDWAYQVGGWWGLLVAVALTYLAPKALKAGMWPKAARLIDELKRERVPRADPKRFSILVARLDDDRDGEQRKLLLHGLHEFKGIEVLPLDRAISPGLITDQAERDGHERARAFLKESGASVVLWGTVLPGGAKPVWRLWWTPATEGQRDGRYGVTAPDLRLPDLLWTDLAAVLGLLITHHDAERAAAEGRFVADQLIDAVARVRTLLTAAQTNSGWSPEQLARTRVVLANALSTLGDQAGQSEPLEEAVAAYRAALEERTRDR